MSCSESGETEDKAEITEVSEAVENDENDEETDEVVEESHSYPENPVEEDVRKIKKNIYRIILFEFRHPQKMKKRKNSFFFIFDCVNKNSSRSSPIIIINY